MTMGNVISLIGMTVEGTGIILTGYGFLQTWREFSAEGLVTDAHPVIRARALAREGWDRAGIVVRRLLRRQNAVVVQVDAAHIKVRGGAMNVRATVGYPPLDPKQRTKESITALDARTREISNRLSAEAEMRQDADDQITESVARVDDRLGEVRGELDSQGRRIAVGGLRLAFAGLVLVFIGLIGQALGVLLG